MPLGTEIGLGPGDIVIDGDPRKGAQQPPTFRPTLARSFISELLFSVFWHNTVNEGYHIQYYDDW